MPHVFRIFSPGSVLAMSGVGVMDLQAAGLGSDVALSHKGFKVKAQAVVHMASGINRTPRLILSAGAFSSPNTTHHPLAGPSS
ncbi:hypothetical protein TK49_03960 [Ralstonia mannitolilytica]|nr:hypothetical protein TK49_03960 [Ralstonia mannitolilytica]